MKHGAGCVFVAALLSCGGSEKKTLVTVPERAATAGEKLLSLVPRGADAVLEADLSRLRENQAVGDLVRALENAGVAPELAGADLFTAADSLIVCTYGLGERAEHVVLIAGARAKDFRGAQPVEDDVFVIATEEWRQRVWAVARKAEKPLSSDRRFLAARTAAMPEKAESAVIRMTALLGFDARVALARDLDLNSVPASFSVWGDVVDDLAVVAVMDGDTAAEGRRLGDALAVLRKRLLAADLDYGVLLKRLIRDARVDVSGRRVRAVLVIGPKRLGRIVSLLLRQLGAAS